MTNKDTVPTIEQSLKMIEEKLEVQKKSKSNNQNIDVTKKEGSKNSPLSTLFEKNKEKKIKPKESDDVLLLTKKVSNKKGKVINLKKNKTLKKIKKDKVEKKEDKQNDLTIKENKNLGKTTDLAVIIKKLKNIRDKKLNINLKKNSKKINKEIKKLNETIDLAEDLFKKELLDL